MSILTISDLTIKHKEKKIVDRLNLTINKGEWLSLVGESGSGKSVTALAIGGFLPSSIKVILGKILFNGRNLVNLEKNELRAIRGKEITYVFQDYQGAFTPFIKIGKQFDEMLKTHTRMSKSERKQLSLRSLNKVGLKEEKVYESYPFQLSGGQLQRANIAMATILKPTLLIADEPTTSLDSLTAKKVLELIAELKEETNCSILFITHDLRLVRKYTDQLAILYQSKLVEYGRKEKIFQHPQHDYSKQLLEAIPPLKEESICHLNEKLPKEIFI